MCVTSLFHRTAHTRMVFLLCINRKYTDEEKPFWINGLFLFTSENIKRKKRHSSIVAANSPWKRRNRPCPLSSFNFHGVMNRTRCKKHNWNLQEHAASQAKGHSRWFNWLEQQIKIYTAHLLHYKMQWLSTLATSMSVVFLASWIQLRLWNVFIWA